MIKAGRCASKVPLSDHGCGVPGLLKKLGKGLLAAVKGWTINDLTVQVVVFARQDRCPARCTNRIGH